MTRNQILGLIGSTILFVGVFTPIVSMPIVGSLNYFQNGRGDGAIVLVLALISALLTAARKYKGLLITGGLSLAVLAFTFITFQWRISQAKASVKSDLGNNPFVGLGEAFMGAIQLQWGWAVLIVGSIFLLAAGLLKDSSMVDQGEGRSLGHGVLSNNKVLGLVIGVIAVLGVGFVVASNLFHYLPSVGDVPGARLLSSKERAKDEINDILTVVYLGKRFEKADYESGIYMDSITVRFEFENKSDRAISGFKGTAEFADMFGDKIKSVKLSYDKPIAPKQKVSWHGSLDYNQFISADSKFRDTDNDKLTFNFVPETVIFADGSKLEVLEH